MCIPSALRDQERVPGALRLESETGVVLEINLKCSKMLSQLSCPEKTLRLEGSFND